MTPTDTAVDAFRYLFDIEFMSRLFSKRLQVVLPSIGQATRCTLLSYRERLDRLEGRRCVKSAMACYELASDDIGNGIRHRVRLYIHAYRDNRSADKFSSILASRRPTQPTTGVLEHWRDLDLIVWSFPNDPRLPLLSTLVDVDRALPHLPYAGLSPRPKGPQDIRQYDVTAVRYHPEDRCTLRCHLRYVVDGSTYEQIVYAKLFKDSRAAGVHRILRNFRDQQCDRPLHLLLPESLEYDETSGVAWQSALPGEPADVVISRQGCRRPLVAIAEGLAALHGSWVVEAGNTDLNDHLHSIQARGSRLQERYPSLESMFDKQLSELRRELPSLTPAPDRLIHGGFRLPQILLHRNVAGIIDLDDMTAGDPAQDLADFIVDLHFRRHTNAGSAHSDRLFLKTYRQCANWSVPKDRLRWFLKAQLLRRATRNPGRFIDPERYEAQVMSVFASILSTTC